MPRQLLRAGIATVLWLMLTVLLASVLIHTSSATNGLIDRHIDGSWVVIAAFLTAVLLGITIESIRVLILSAVLMWLVAALALALLVMLPVWEGVIPRTDAITNYAINQAIVLPLLMSLPGAFGALCGNLLRRLLGGWQELLPLPRAESGRLAWWDRR